MSLSRLKLISGTANPDLSKAISDYLGVNLCEVEIKRFSDGEIFAEVNENVRGSDAFILQPTSSPANDHLMELLILIDALKRASANRITAVIPYYGYARQDRKSAPRTPITAKLVADLITTAGADRVLTMDLHAGQIQGFFNIPVDNIFAMPVILEALRQRMSDPEKTVIVSPDVGGVVRARALAKRLGVNMAIIDKRRPKANVAEVMNIIGEVAGMDCILMDDMIDTAGTLTQAAGALKAAGATRILAAATHPVLSGPAIDRIAASSIDEVLVTDTIALQSNARGVDKLTVLSMAPLLGEAVRRISDEESVSSLFV